MAPLHVQVYNDPNIEEDADWNEFNTYLQNAKSIGVYVVTVDVWWGLVQEDGKDSFDWSYYKNRFHLAIKISGII